MRVVIYARVSTDDHEQDTERQVLKCRQYCELHNHIVIDVIEDYVSGDTEPFKRRNGQVLLSKDPEGIVIFSMDRLSRQHPVKVITLIQSLKDRGIKVISITEPAFNMESEFAEIMLYLITWFNNYFLKKLKRDIKSGMDKARLEGKVIGRPVNKFNKLRAYQLLFVENKSIRSVARDMGVPIATMFRFKKEAVKDPRFFIKKV